jgi:hypothetical protein
VEEPVFKPGDRICPTCGMGNDPARKFCRRCGSSLELAAVAVAAKRPPWYRRLFRKSQDTLQAGARPQSMAEPRTTVSGLLGRVLPFAVVVIIMGVIGSYLVVPDVQLEVNRTVAQLKRQFLPDLVDVTPVARNEALRAVDGNLVTWWESDEERPTLTLRFDPPVDLGNLIVTAGANADDFPTHRRPLALDLVVDGEVGATLQLADSKEPQSQRIDLRDVGQLRIVVTGMTGPNGAPVAIRELEFKAIR